MKLKNPPAMQETWVRSLGWEDPLEKARQPIPVFLPGESPQTEEPSPWGCKELDMTDLLAEAHRLPDPGIEPMFSESPTLASEFLTTEPPGKLLDTVSFPNYNLESILLFFSDI